MALPFEGLAGHALGDRNELALAFVMTLPICYYLLGQYGQRSRIISLGLLGTMLLLVTAVIGTQSRGGFVALAIACRYLQTEGVIKASPIQKQAAAISVIAMSVSASRLLACARRNSLSLRPGETPSLA